MNGRRRIVFLALFVFCTAAVWAPTADSAPVETHRGYYVFGHEVRTFQPCGSDRVLWVKAEQQISQQLREQHQQLTTKPYEPVYIEIAGYFTEKATAGFAADYEGQIVIESVDLVRAMQQGDCSNAATAGDSITGVVWKWQQTRLGDGQTMLPDDPDRYTIAFQPDGNLAIRADCNRVRGNYTIENTSLAIETTFSTRAMCPPDSLEQTYLKHLNAAAIYFMQEGSLFVDLQADTGTMKFSK